MGIWLRPLPAAALHPAAGLSHPPSPLGRWLLGRPRLLGWSQPLGWTGVGPARPAWASAGDRRGAQGLARQRPRDDPRGAARRQAERDLRAGLTDPARAGGLPPAPGAALPSRNGHHP